MELAQQIAAILLVFGLLGLSLKLLKDKGLAGFAGIARTRKSRRLEVLERAVLSPSQSLVVVRVDNATLLIGASSSGVSVLRTMGEDSH